MIQLLGIGLMSQNRQRELKTLESEKFVGSKSNRAKGKPSKRQGRKAIGYKVPMHYDRLAAQNFK